MKKGSQSKTVDFDVLKTASNALLEYFRMDETQPDLYDQISSHDNGAHKYYVEPYHTIFPLKMVNVGSLFQRDDLLILTSSLLRNSFLFPRPS